MEEATLKSIGSLIESLGFPIVVTVYLLFRFEKKLSKLTTTVKDLKETLNQEK